MWKVSDDWWVGGNCIAKFPSFMIMFLYFACHTDQSAQQGSPVCVCVPCRECSGPRSRGWAACARRAACRRAWCSPSSRASTSSMPCWTEPWATPHSPASSTATSCSASEDSVGWVTPSTCLDYCFPFPLPLPCIWGGGFGELECIAHRAVPEVTPWLVWTIWFCRQTGGFILVF